jgi:hypothetical protein
MRMRNCVWTTGAALFAALWMPICAGAQTQTQGATSFGMIGISAGQTLQLNLVAFPPSPIFPPEPICMAEMGFQDTNGKPLGTSKIVTLSMGESASLTLNGSTLAKTGQRVEVQPIVTPNATYPPDPCFASVELMDNLIGTVVGVPGSVGYPPEPIFGMLSVTALETARLNVVAYPPNPCIGQLRFADKNGNMLGKPLPVNLNPGQAAFLDLPGITLYPPTPSTPGAPSLFPPEPLHPIVTLATASNADVAPTACIASVEVYSPLTGQTVVYFPPVPVFLSQPITP